MKFYNREGEKIGKIAFITQRDLDVMIYGNALMYKVPGGLRLVDPTLYINVTKTNS